MVFLQVVCFKNYIVQPDDLIVKLYNLLANAHKVVVALFVQFVKQTRDYFIVFFCGFATEIFLNHFVLALCQLYCEFVIHGISPFRFDKRIIAYWDLIVK